MVGEEGNNAILEFLMNDKKEEVERKAKEKKQEEERRLAEREEDARRMEKFQDNIINTMKTEIKNEIQVAVEPIKERQDKSEKEAVETNKKMELMMAEMKELKDKLNKVVENEKASGNRAEENDSEDVANKERVPTGWRNAVMNNRGLENRSHQSRGMDEQNQNSGGMEDKSVKMIRNAKRILGFKPIDKVHVHHCMRRVEQDTVNQSLSKEEAWEKAKKNAVNDFLKYEMKMKEEDINQLEVEMIYPPAKEEWNVLYVEFKYEEMVNFIMSFAQFLQKGEKENRPSIEKYIPMELFKRYSAIEKLAFEIRQKSNFKTATNVSFGEKDFILKSRPKEIHPGGRRVPWSQLEPITLPEDIPKFEMNLVRRGLPQSPRSPGQAPGRPPLTPDQSEKRKTRGSPCNSSPVTPTAKQQKTVTSPIHPVGSSSPASQSLNISNRFQCLANPEI